jgi:hypothetical protein
MSKFQLGRPTNPNGATAENSRAETDVLDAANMS